MDCSNTKTREIIIKKYNKIQEQGESFIQTKIISSISITLIQLVSENRTKPDYKTKLKLQIHSPFTSLSIPSISLSDYLHRIWKYSKMDESSLIFALVYIDRMCTKNNIILTEFNVHRILCSSILIAIKFNEDKFFTNKYYSKIGGMELKQLNEMEMEFLVAINFHMFIENKLFEKYKRNLYIQSE